ncbi:MAG: glycosyltransferase [Candidatus Gracilibacteria bacterium]|nr:glycosyltransferase [Candidatus Gracilibacteria bacterium]
MPRVSIITTTYKHQDFIAETIESVLSQTFTDWELLIGDDSPDDLTWNIIQEYVQRYPDKIKAWHYKQNKGIVNNMNFLIDKISNESEYIAFLEGDDLFTPDNLEKKIDIFKKYKDVKMVYNNLDYIDKDSNILLKDFFKGLNSVIQNKKLELENFVNGNGYYNSYSSLMIKKDLFKIFKITGLGNKNFVASDWYLFGNIANNYNIYGIKDSLTLLRKHGENTSSDFLRMYKDVVTVFEKFKEEKPEININYKIFQLKTYLSYLNHERLSTIKFGIISFRYSLTKDFPQRIGMILLSLFPKKINNYLYNKLKK